MPRSVTASVLACVVALGVPAAAARAETGPYLDSATQPPYLTQQAPAAAPVMGPEGVPQVRYAWGVEDNPVTVAQAALQRWSWWTVRHDPADRAAAIHGADWLVAHQAADGSWPYAFDFDAAGVPMRAPWISALAQGQAMSLLVRAYAATGTLGYLQAAIRALAPFAKTVEQGGVVSDWDGVPWFEEYPGPAAQHVLNGFEFTLIGLDDLAPYSARAAQLYQQGIASLVARISSFDAPAQLSQYYAALGAGRHPVTGVYLHAHAVLTRRLADLTGNQVLADYAARWEGYERGMPAPTAYQTTVTP